MQFIQHFYLAIHLRIHWNHTVCRLQGQSRQRTEIMLSIEHVDSIISGSVDIDNYLQMTDKAIVKHCSSKMSPLILKCYHNGPVSVQLFPFRLFLQLFRWHSLDFQGYADALFKSTQLIISLWNRAELWVLKVLSCVSFPSAYLLMLA